MAALTLLAAERAEKRWILGALGIAVLMHALMAGFFGWYKIRGLAIPSDHGAAQVGPFTLKQIEINPNSLREQANPTAALPKAEESRRL